MFLSWVCLFLPLIHMIVELKDEVAKSSLQVFEEIFVPDGVKLIAVKVLAKSFVVIVKDVSGRPMHFKD